SSKHVEVRRRFFPLPAHDRGQVMIPKSLYFEHSAGLIFSKGKSP
ncbi:uncharacterized protein METZ01_LOCUS54690, partial [marine metagenome]